MKRKASSNKRDIGSLPDFISGLKPVEIVILLALFFLFLYHAHKGWVTTKDDAFITFRYAEHLARGQGLVWNIGEPPVEGYTNFLFLVIMAFFALFKADLVVAAKVVSLISAIGIFLMLAWLLLRIYKDGVVLFFGVFLFVFPYFTSAHIAAGLETMFYSVLVICAAMLLLQQIEGYSGRRKVAFSLTLLALGLTRPEGVLVAGVLILVELFLVKESRRKKSLALLALLYVLPGAIYMGARFMYFHSWLPNPFYVKKSDKLFSLIGLIELQDFVLKTKIYIALLFLPFLESKARKPLIVLSVIFIPSLAVYMFFRPMMNYAFRYYQPYYALMIPVLAAPLFVLEGLLARILSSRGASEASKRAGAIALLAAFIYFTCPYVFPNFKPNYTEFKYWRRQGVRLKACHVLIGKLLGHFPEYRDRLIALGDCGAIPYYSKWRVLDMGGLNDVYLAHKGQSISREMEALSTKLDLDYVFKKDPAVIIVVSSNPVSIDHYASRVLEQDKRFAMYKRIIAFKYLPGMYELIYVKKEDPSLQGLIDGLLEFANRQGAQQIDLND